MSTIDKDNEEINQNITRSIRKKKWVNSSVMIYKDHIRHNSARRSKLSMLVLKDLVRLMQFTI